MVKLLSFFLAIIVTAMLQEHWISINIEEKQTGQWSPFGGYWILRVNMSRKRNYISNFQIVGLMLCLAILAL
jgi:hypothetical protein